MEHQARVREEFTRQAESFAASPAVAEASLTKRFVAAMTPAAGGTFLDVACGPGILTAALAPISREITGVDLTPEMLARAKVRCTNAGLANVTLLEGDATHLPFPAARFDAVVTRLSVHHLEQPALMLGEIFRVLKAGGLFVLGDNVSSEDRAESDLHNALEVLRDPSHVRMVPASELVALVEGAGFTITRREAWDRPRRFAEWMTIANDPGRIAPLRIVLGTLARAGQSAGIALALDADDVTFVHHWLLLEARKPDGA